MTHSQLHIEAVSAAHAGGPRFGFLSRLRRVRTVDEKELRWADEVRAAREGDRAAFEALVRGVQRPVYGLSLRLLGNEAEAAEIAQEAFLRAYQHLDRFDASRSFEVWILSIARNLCLDLLRRRGKVRTEELAPLSEVLPSSEPSLEERAIQSETHRGLEDALSTLPETDREVLSLYYVQKRTTKEIAGVLGVAPGTIMARLFRAREKLRRILAPAAKPDVDGVNA